MGGPQRSSVDVASLRNQEPDTCRGSNGGSAYVDRSPHPRFLVAFDGAGERESTALAGEKLHPRRLGGIETDQVEAAGFDVQGVIDDGEWKSPKVGRFELVRDLSAIDEDEPDGPSGVQLDHGWTKGELGHLYLDNPRRQDRRTDDIGRNYHKRHDDETQKTPHQQGWGGNRDRPPQHHQSLLNGVSSGLNSPKIPFGFGYQIHMCSVTSGGCQKVNSAPDLALVLAHFASAVASTNSPSL